MKIRSKKIKDQPGRIKFYADENVDSALIKALKHFYKVNIKTALELGCSGRDDNFHFNEAKRLERFLLTTDMDFLDHRKFPFKQTFGVVVLNGIKNSRDLGYMSWWLTEHVVPSKKEIIGTKIIIYRDHLEIYFRDETGKVKKQRVP